MTIFLFFLVLICAAVALWQSAFSASRRCLASDGFFNFFIEDDSDIKIAGEEPVNNTDSAQTDASELEVQRRCGNLEKAHALGTLLSDKIISQDGESSFGQDSDEDTLTRTQRRLLLAFAALSTVESNIESHVLQGVVKNVFYDSLKKLLPNFYEDISKSASFSFYMLCDRRGGDIERSIGHTFAMLVAKEGDTVIEELGKALYLRFVDVTLQSIRSFDLK